VTCILPDGMHVFLNTQDQHSVLFNDGNATCYVNENST